MFHQGRRRAAQRFLTLFLTGLVLRHLITHLPGSGPLGPLPNRVVSATGSNQIYLPNIPNNLLNAASTPTASPTSAGSGTATASPSATTTHLGS